MNEILDETAQLDAVKYTEVVHIEDEGWAIKTLPYKNHPLGGVSLLTYRTKAKAQEAADKQNEQIIAAIGKDRKDTPRFHVVSPIGFYSTVEKALELIKQEKGTKDQFKAMLVKNGAKQAELDWMGFDELPEKLTKSDIQNWIDENRIEVEVEEKVEQFPITKDDVES